MSELAFDKLKQRFLAFDKRRQRMMNLPSTSSGNG
jgi:hypothetical protein